MRPVWGATQASYLVGSAMEPLQFVDLVALVGQEGCGLSFALDLVKIFRMAHRMDRRRYTDLVANRSSAAAAK
jgi:hypothetical protein